MPDYLILLGGVTIGYTTCLIVGWIDILRNPSREYDNANLPYRPYRQDWEG